MIWRFQSWPLAGKKAANSLRKCTPTMLDVSLMLERITLLPIGNDERRLTKERWERISQ